MAPHSETLFYSGSLLTIREFHCPGEDIRGNDEESALEHEIVFPRSGVYVRRDARDQVIADPNHVLFFHRNQPYQISHPVRGGDVSTVFSITPDVLFDLLASATDTGIENPDQPFKHGAIRVPPVVKAAHIALLHAVEHAQGRDALALEERILAFLSWVLSSEPFETVLEDDCCRSAASQRAHEELVAHTKIVIGENYHCKLALGFIAQQVHHSPFSLSRIFKRHAGLTIHQYLLRTRLLHGLERLAESADGVAIGEIGVELGFASPSHFATSFLQVFRITPSHFREKINNKKLLQMEKYLPYWVDLSGQHSSKQVSFRPF